MKKYASVNSYAAKFLKAQLKRLKVNLKGKTYAGRISKKGTKT